MRFRIFSVSSVVAVVSVIALGANWFSAPESMSPDRQEAGTALDDEINFEPVDNMHRFMEYMVDPPYQELKTAFASEPANRSVWRKLKPHVLVLGESNVLVADRGPDDTELNDEQKKQWRQISFDCFKSARELYQTVGKRDYAKSRIHYEAMINSCNKCHEVFDEGRNILEFYAEIE